MNHEQRQKRFARLVEAHARDIYRMAFWLCRNKELADDIVQETMTRAWKSIDRLQDENAAKPWLFTILRREHARVYEKNRPETVELDETLLADPDQHNPEMQEQINQLRKAIMKLDEKYRDPLMMQIIGGFSCDEIADQLGISKAAVMTQLFRAREQLKSRLGKGLAS